VKLDEAKAASPVKPDDVTKFQGELDDRQLKLEEQIVATRIKLKEERLKLEDEMVVLIRDLEEAERLAILAENDGVEDSQYEKAPKAVIDAELKIEQKVAEALEKWGFTCLQESAQERIDYADA